MANRFTFEYGNISNDRWTTTTVVTNKKTFAEYLQSEGYNVTLWELVPGVYMQIDKHNMPTGLAFGLKQSAKTDEPESGEICL